jgi:hypothetical protein
VNKLKERKEEEEALIMEYLAENEQILVHNKYNKYNSYAYKLFLKCTI